MRVGVLEDVTVVECSTFVTGPYAARLLADLGARVIKIESTGDGDPYRYFAPDPFYSPNFAHLNTNKESLALDLKTSEGHEIATRLIERSDVFIENFRPGTAHRLGLGYEDLSAVNSKLVYCSISAFGQTGPYVDKPGFDTLGQSMAGLLGMLTDLDDPKVMGIALSDYVTGLSAAFGIMGALFNRQKTGSGCKLDTSLLQASLSFIGESAAGYMKTGEVPGRMARVRNAQAFAFLAKDKLPLVIHCSVPEKFWLGLVNAVDRKELAADKRFKSRDSRRKNYKQLQVELAKVFATQTREEWLKRLESNDVPAGPLYNMAEVLADPQVHHLGLIHEVKHAKTGSHRFVGSAVNYPDLNQAPASPPPLLGEHSRSILAELGYSRARVKSLMEQGITNAGADAKGDER